MYTYSNYIMNHVQVFLVLIYVHLKDLISDCS